VSIREKAQRNSPIAHTFEHVYGEGAGTRFEMERDRDHRGPASPPREGDRDFDSLIDTKGSV
jgi:hypothetical protein